METHLHPVQVGDCMLRTSPEFALKRAVSAGLGRVYEIGPCFRERESGPWHRREFLMLEWYRVGATLPDLMDEYVACAEVVSRALGQEPETWRRVTVAELFRRYCEIEDVHAASVEVLSSHPEGWEDAFMRRWVSEIEPKLTGALLVYDWPAPLAALARTRSEGGQTIALRFEAYLHGRELANAFAELGDAKEQLRRFHTANQQRAEIGEPAHPVDPRFIEAVGSLPLCSGIAVGLERMIAVMVGWDSLQPGRFD